MQFGIPHRSITFGLLKRIAAEWSTDNATRWSASVAFYTLLSLAPLLVLTVTIAGLFYSKKVAQGQLVLDLRNLVGPDVGRAIQILLTSPHKPVSGLLAAVFGIMTLFFGASAVLTELRDALNAIWHVPVNRNRTHLANLLRVAKERVYSFVMILGLGVLLLVSLVLNTWFGYGKIFRLANVRFRLFPASHRVLDFVFGYYICICRRIQVDSECMSELERRPRRSSRYLHIVYHWQTAHCTLYGQDKFGIRLRCSRVAHCCPDLGVLLGASLLLRSGIYESLRRDLRLPKEHSR